MDTKTPDSRVTIAVLSDLHYGPEAVGDRRGDLADVLFRRTVHRLNRFIKPDVVVLLGDLVNDGEAPDAATYLEEMRAIADTIDAPVIAVAGNHDGPQDAFYEVFERPAPTIDVRGVRFVSFLDPEEPGWNARRTLEDLARMRKARAGFDGPIVALQHVPLFPPGADECPFNYTNAEDIVADMEAHAIDLAVSGHYHPGMALIRRERSAYLAAPALCESPFRFLTIILDGDHIEVEEHALRVPQELGLIDTHVHSQFAYCSEDMDMAVTWDLAEAFGLAGLVFAEHSGQLYFDKETFWKGHFFPHGIGTTQGVDNRLAAYVAAYGEIRSEHTRIGLEFDCDFAGRAVVKPNDRDHFDFFLGAMHQLPELMTPIPDPARAYDEFMAMLEAFLQSGIRVLAHPFRVFRRGHVPIPTHLFGPVVRLLRKHGVAPEINFHTNKPPIEFVKLCLAADVKLAFGSDAHNRREIGEFWPHLELLKACGFDGDVRDALIDPFST